MDDKSHLQNCFVGQNSAIGFTHEEMNTKRLTSFELSGNREIDFNEKLS